MRAGASASRGDILWFLHADSRPDAGALLAMERALAEDEGAAGGNFRLVFDGEGAAERQMTWLYPKLRLLGLSYGDAGIFVRWRDYEAIGGVRPYGLFEDLDLVNRLKRAGRFVHLDCPLTTSSRRFAGRNYVRVWAVWLTLQLLFWAGVSPDRLARWYGMAR
jgi:GT2 family glycosyltransferase